MTHEVKSHPLAFEARWARLKPWELRKNDRGYEVGHHLHEREYESGSYTGRYMLSRITYLLGEQGQEFGIPGGYCIMTVEEIARGHWLPRQEEPR